VAKSRQQAVGRGSIRRSMWRRRPAQRRRLLTDSRHRPRPGRRGLPAL